MAKRIPGFFHRDDGYWYYRKRVPKDVQRFFKEREIWIALGTTNRGEAETQFYLVAAQQLQVYEDLRQKLKSFVGDSSSTPPSTSKFSIDRQQAVALAKAYLAECLSSTDSRKTARDLGTNAGEVREELYSDIGNLRDPEDGDDGRFMVQNAARNLIRLGG